MKRLLSLPTTAAVLALVTGTASVQAQQFNPPAPASQASPAPGPRSGGAPGQVVRAGNAATGQGQGGRGGDVTLQDRIKVVELDLADQLGQQFEFAIAEPLEAEAPVKNAPFSAEAVNEFTQVLGDGNRIERRFSTSLSRDSQGRTRSEQEIALVGPLTVNGEPPRLVTITDPVAGVSYTLDEPSKTANRGVKWNVGKLTLANKLGSFIHTDQQDDKLIEPTDGVVVDLGTRLFEGVAAQGTRTTMTIPAGAIGNVAPIEVVSERWFSKELQTAVMITRRDPRSGDTVYRLTNIVRVEPPADLFVVPSDYRLIPARKSFNFSVGQTFTTPVPAPSSAPPPAESGRGAGRGGARGGGAPVAPQ